MDVRQSPFSLYDFLGYFVPGAALVYLLGPASDALGFNGIATSLAKITKVSDVLPFVLVAYLLGHLVALCSSFLIERFAIWRYGYPSKYLLNENAGTYWASAGVVPGLLIGLVLLPVILMDFAVGRLLGLSKFFCQPLDKMLTALIKRRVNEIFAAMAGSPPLGGFPAQSSDFFRGAYHFAVEHAPAHLPKMQNYVALFGFYRAFSMISVFAFWYAVACFAFGLAPKNLSTALVCGALVASYLFFVGFLKFYRRFSLEALMAATVANKR